ncbi:cation transporter [Aerococcaceae bacterium DSM 111020]|nr:cation transporter [Aerococcaceae bacterium DSM 111020]
MMTKLFTWTKENVLLSVAGILAVFAILLGQFDLSFINFNVLATLGGLMLVLGLFAESGLLRRLTVLLINHSDNTRQLGGHLIVLYFFASFFLSNDIAILTLLPIYLKLLRRLPSFRGQILLAGLIAVAANLGGVFFPFSNPQNLIIHRTFAVPFTSFVLWMLPLAVTGFLLLLVSCFLIERQAINETVAEEPLDQSLLPWALIGMVIMLAAVFSLLNVYLAFGIIVIGIMLLRPALFRYLDVKLLLTFACFFIIVGNVTNIEAVSNWVQTHVQDSTVTYLLSILTSQFVSKVPTTMLMTPLTNQVQALLWGVNIGGLGTFIASLANILAINCVKQSDTMTTRSFMKSFLVTNGVYLLVLTGIFYLAL